MKIFSSILGSFGTREMLDQNLSKRSNISVWNSFLEPLLHTHIARGYIRCSKFYISPADRKFKLKTIFWKKNIWFWIVVRRVLDQKTMCWKWILYFKTLSVKMYFVREKHRGGVYPTTKLNYHIMTSPSSTYKLKGQKCERAEALKNA